MWNPLFPYSLALILLAIFLVDRGTRSGQNRDLWLSGLCVGVLSLIHPYQVPLILILALFIAIVRRGRAGVGCWARFAAAAFPLVLFTFLTVKLHPLAAMHSLQGEMQSRRPIAYLLGFGLPLLLTCAALVLKPRQMVSEYWPLLLWLAVAGVLAYSPFWFRTKFIFGIHVPMCILSGVAAGSALAGIRLHWLRCWSLILAACLLLPLAISTRLSMLPIDRQIVRENNEGLYYLNADVLGALDFLKYNSEPDDLVFADLSTSQLIPAFSGNTTVWGHWAMSVDFPQREVWFQKVFDPQSSLDLERIK
jgi:hypothetical protein